jgi:hypothetical protein
MEKRLQLWFGILFTATAPIVVGWFIGGGIALLSAACGVNGSTLSIIKPSTAGGGEIVRRRQGTWQELLSAASGQV